MLISTVPTPSGRAASGATRRRVGPVSLIAAVAGSAALGYAMMTILGSAPCGDVDQPACTSGALVSVGLLPLGIACVLLASMTGLGGVAAGTGCVAIGVGAVVGGSTDTSALPGFSVVFGIGFILAGLLCGVVTTVVRRRFAALTAAPLGAPATATLIDVRDTGMTFGDDPFVELRALVTPADGTPAFEARTRACVSRVAVPRAGDTIPATLDPLDPRGFRPVVG